MSEEDAEFLAILKQEFVEETPENLEECERYLMDYHDNGDEELIVDLKRKIHSIKGSAKAVDMPELSDALHYFEDRIDSLLTSGEKEKIYDEGLRVVDSVKLYLTSVEDESEDTSILVSLKAS